MGLKEQLDHRTIHQLEKLSFRSKAQHEDSEAPESAKLRASLNRRSRLKVLAMLKKCVIRVPLKSLVATRRQESSTLPMPFLLCLVDLRCLATLRLSKRLCPVDTCSQRRPSPKSAKASNYSQPMKEHLVLKPVSKSPQQGTLILARL